MRLYWKEHIESNPKVMFGKPVIKGTRIPVDLILEKLSLGETIAQLLKAYPSIKIDSIYACLKFASESVKKEILTGITNALDEVKQIQSGKKKTKTLKEVIKEL